MAILTSGFCAFRASPTPASVPPVPTAQVKPSTVPLVCAQISGPVVRRCPSRLARLSNWFAQIAPSGSSAARRSGQSSRQLHVIVGVLVGDRRHLDQRRALQAQHVLLLLALRFGNDDDRLEAQSIGNEREADPSVAGRALDDSAARLQHAARDHVLDNGEPGAIFHRPARIHEFGLAQDAASCRLRSVMQLDERRVADGVDDGGRGHGSFLVGEPQG